MMTAQLEAIHRSATTDPESVPASGDSANPEAWIHASERPRLYLAGPMQHCDDNGQGWRESVIEEEGFRFRFHNPIDNYEPPEETEGVYAGISPAYVVEGDKSMIADCDAVLAFYEDVPGTGTPQELLWAWERGIPVAVWSNCEENSPWLLYHADVVSSDLKPLLYWLERNGNRPRWKRITLAVKRWWRQRCF